MRQCSVCKEWKEEDEYHKRNNRASKLRSECKKCSYETRTIYNKTDTVKKRLKYIYRSTIEHYNKMLASQDNKCAICGKEFSDSKKPCIDHDHITDEIRGLLCNKCNLLLGHAEDSIHILASAIKYLT